jgi:cytochrome oxidase Cu insertion factor (SCO1/SenC/PrrC family)
MPAITALLLFLAAVPALRVAPATAADGGGATWGAEYFPNILLTIHAGKTVRFFDDLIKDKVVMINFIYTSCPDVCPRETARLREVQKNLRDRVGKDVFMYSITVDPQRDTPEVLRKYAKRFDAGPAGFSLPERRPKSRRSGRSGRTFVRQA